MPRYEWEYLLRDLAPQVLGALIRRYGDFDAAEDALQEALLAAAVQWPDSGVPENPRGWLIQVAQRRLVDAVRAEAARRNREAATMIHERTVRPPVAETEIDEIDRDDTLTLFFLCCHPALPAASAIALTLRAVGGLTTAEIAHAFLIPETTMAQRITRAKKRLSALERPFARPDPETDSCRAEWRARLGAVLHVLYLIFTEGHTSTAGDELRRADLSGEAIRLARNLHALLPDDTEVTGLLALLLLTDARRAARTGPHGELIPLAEQDRGRWDRDLILEGVRLATATLGSGLIGPYQIQAAIAVLHVQPLRPEDTEWRRILVLYNALERLAPNPMVTLNRAVATAMVHGPQAGLDLTDTVAGALSGNHRLDAVRGHLHEMNGDHARALTCYLRAATRTTSRPEHDYLTLRAAHLRTQRHVDDEYPGGQRHPI